MRNVGAERNYKFGSKNNWRRRLWNEVLRRTAGREKTELILYLAGSQDLDRPVAISKGVPSRNLIAVDIHLANVRRVRSASNYALHADVVAILRSWPADVPVCAILLDFNSGLKTAGYLKELSNLMMWHRPLANAVLAVNLQRGRDAAANVLTAETQQVNRFMRSQGNVMAHAVSPKHRGFAFVFFFAMVGCLDQGALRHSCREVGENIDRMTPRFFSYRSGLLVFDSVVLSPLSSPLYTSPVFDPNVLELVLRTSYPKEQQTVRKIAATLATRTRQYEQRA